MNTKLEDTTARQQKEIDALRNIVEEVILGSSNMAEATPLADGE